MGPAQAHFPACYQTHPHRDHLLATHNQASEHAVLVPVLDAIPIRICRLADIMGSKSSVCIDIVVDTWVRERLSSPAWLTPFISQYPNAYPLVDKVGVRLFLVSSSLDRLGLGYKSSRLRNLLNLIKYRIGRKGNKRPCKQAPSKLARFDLLGKLPVCSLLTPYFLLVAIPPVKYLFLNHPVS